MDTPTRPDFSVRRQNRFDHGFKRVTKLTLAGYGLLLALPILLSPADELSGPAVWAVHFLHIPILVALQRSLRQIWKNRNPDGLRIWKVMIFIVASAYVVLMGLFLVLAPMVFPIEGLT